MNGTDHALATQAPPETKSHAGIVRILIILAVVAGLVVASRTLPVTQWLKSFLEWTEGLGFWGPTLLAGFYVLACVLFVPGSILTLGAGAVFGLVVGTVTVSVGSTVGAAAAFLVGRTLAREWVAGKVAGSRKFAAIDEAVGREGFKIVLLTRLSPVFPFNMLNYGFGLTKVRLRDYVLASWIGMFPGTVMYVYLGTVIGEVGRLGAGGRQKTAGEWVLLGVGLLVTVVVTVFVTKIARRALAEATAIGEEG
jgi:uncharacterized membrane protein YdjX (TVP38/TMEM64 family)